MRKRPNHGPITARLVSLQFSVSGGCTYLFFFSAIPVAEVRGSMAVILIVQVLVGFGPCVPFWRNGGDRLSASYAVFHFCGVERGRREGWRGEMEGGERVGEVVCRPRNTSVRSSGNISPSSSELNQPQQLRYGTSCVVSPIRQAQRHDLVASCVGANRVTAKQQAARSITDRSTDHVTSGITPPKRLRPVISFPLVSLSNVNHTVRGRDRDSNDHKKSVLPT